MKFVFICSLLIISNFTSFSQVRTITARVLNAADTTAIKNVSVLVEYNIGTFTNELGYFQLQAIR